MSAAMSLPTSILELPDGLHRDVPEAIYHQRIPGVASKSALDLVDRAPAVYAEWLKGAVREESEALAFGRAFHCALLEPGVYDQTYAVEPKFGDCRKTENKKRRDDWRGENAGRVLIESEDAMAVVGMARAIRMHPLANRMLRDGVPELTLKWTDPDTGIICKGRADYHVDSMSLCVDVKTTDDAREGAFSRSVANYGYFKQAAFYSDGFDAIGKSLGHGCFWFLCVEKRAPYLVDTFNLDDDAIARGREWSRRTLRKLADCVESGEYPGYPVGVKTLSLPRWA